MNHIFKILLNMNHDTVEFKKELLTKISNLVNIIQTKRIVKYLLLKKTKLKIKIYQKSY